MPTVALLSMSMYSRHVVAQCGPDPLLTCTASNDQNVLACELVRVLDLVSHNDDMML